ncbi:hypothetical protein E2C01_072557 [Portunus trituberculatus]|uniref:Uncharacterized protein n=1 Tax=Portunus trituberculatus TaxID=210409 RepID=A0A5B7I2W4_PORTR|nr:hypothetical protein [Portunus trituberculatus]
MKGHMSQEDGMLMQDTDRKSQGVPGPDHRAVNNTNIAMVIHYSAGGVRSTPQPPTRTAVLYAQDPTTQ